MRKAHLAGVAMAWSFAVLAATMSAQTADRLLDRYIDAVDVYQAGDLRRAVALVAGWSGRDFESAVSRALDRNDRRLIETAAVFQTELALTGFDQGSRSGASHLDLAEMLVRSKQVGLPLEFQQQWYAVAASLFLSVGDLAGARLLTDRGLKLPANNARLHMIDGATDELRAHLQIPEIAEPAGPARTELLWAEGKFRRALQIDPRLAEARMRLGRILFLQKQPERARTELEMVVGSVTNRRLLYLTHLFLGAVYASKDELSGARREYEAAIEAAPEYQTAYLALSFVEQMAGQDVRAHAVLTSSIALPAADDPWRAYQNGSVDIDGLQWLRERIR